MIKLELDKVLESISILCSMVEKDECIRDYLNEYLSKICHLYNIIVNEITNLDVFIGSDYKIKGKVRIVHVDADGEISIRTYEYKGLSITKRGKKKVLGIFIQAEFFIPERYTRWVEYEPIELDKVGQSLYERIDTLSEIMTKLLWLVDLKHVFYKILEEKKTYIKCWRELLDELESFLHEKVIRVIDDEVRTLEEIRSVVKEFEKNLR